MLNIRSFTALCVVTLCVAIAAVVESEDSGAIPGSGKPLFPGLMPRLNEIEMIQLENATGRFVLKRTKTGWMVPDKFDYPADADKVHKLLLGAAGLTRVEPKTQNPALYSRLGLAAIGDEASKAMSYRLESSDESAIATLTVGNSAPAKGDPELSEFYVRVPDDPQIWLVEGKLPRGNTLIEWVARSVVGIDRRRVREAQVKHESGEIVSVIRESPLKDDFQLPNAPASKTVDAQWKLNDIGRLFSNLELEDVRPRDQAPLQGEPAFIVTMRTFDGLEIRMKVFGIGDEALGILEAEFLPARVATEAKIEAMADAKESLRSVEEVRAEVAALNARWDGWAYVLPAFKVDAMARTQSELSKDQTQEKKPDQG
ncbi:MAG: DUF4340 domain-containing protein [Gammaproteobacteria bacterium]|nr:DUF4340 domain-containing protein [Gammaproteobacteria bacterium]